MSFVFMPLSSKLAPSKFLRRICLWREGRLLLFLNFKFLELGQVMLITLNLRTKNNKIIKISKKKEGTKY